MSTLSILSLAVQIARGEVGYKEGPRNKNKYAGEAFPDVQNAAWCGSFVGWCYKKAGFDIGAHVWVPYVPYVETWAKKIGAWKTSGQKEGDLVVYGFGSSRGKHIGISWPDPNAKGYRAIEGNTSAGTAGSQSNGDGVYIRYRGRSSIRGWVDMRKVLAHYGIKDVSSVGKGAAKVVVTKAQGKVPASSSKLVVNGLADKEMVREIQARLKTLVPELVVDGIAGPATIKALQKYLGTPQDGVISGQNDYCIARMPAVRKDCIRKDNRGSKMVRYLQAYAGTAHNDGKAGDTTWRDVARMMNKYSSFLTTADRVRVGERVKAAKIG